MMGRCPKAAVVAGWGDSLQPRLGKQPALPGMLPAPAVESAESVSKAVAPDQGKMGT